MNKVRIANAKLNQTQRVLQLFDTSISATLRSLCFFVLRACVHAHCRLQNCFSPLRYAVHKHDVSICPYAHVLTCSPASSGLETNLWLLSNLCADIYMLCFLLSFPACLCVSLHALPNFLFNHNQVGLADKYKGRKDKNNMFSAKFRQSAARVRECQHQKTAQRESHHLFWQKTELSASYDEGEGARAEEKAWDIVNRCNPLFPSSEKRCAAQIPTASTSCPSPALLLGTVTRNDPLSVPQI